MGCLLVVDGKRVEGILILFTCRGLVLYSQVVVRVENSCKGCSGDNDGRPTIVHRKKSLHAAKASLADGWKFSTLDQ
jgi:hypothetical protein